MKVNNYNQNYQKFLYSKENNVFFAPLMEAGLIGYLQEQDGIIKVLTGVKSGQTVKVYLLDDDVLNEVAILFKDTPLEKEHGGEIVGQVIEVFRNTNGFYTDTGSFVKPDYKWWFKFIIDNNKISSEEVINIGGVSTDFFVTEKIEATQLPRQDYNGIPFDCKITGIKANAIALVNESRFNICEQLVNSSMSDIKKDEATTKVENNGDNMGAMMQTILEKLDMLVKMQEKKDAQAEKENNLDNVPESKETPAQEKKENTSEEHDVDGKKVSLEELKNAYRAMNKKNTSDEEEKKKDEQLQNSLDNKKNKALKDAQDRLFNSYTPVGVSGKADKKEKIPMKYFI